MKKATFLFMMLIVLLGASKEVGAKEYHFTGFTVSLEEIMIDDERKVLITKGGMDPFETILGLEGYHLFYNGLTMYGDDFVVYGYAMGGYDMRDYSGFFFVVDEDGTIVLGEEGVLDYDFRGDVKNVYTYDDHLMIELQQTNEIGYHIEVMHHIYLLFDETYTMIAEHSVDGLVHEVFVDDWILRGRVESGTQFDFGISSSGELIWKDCLKFLNDVILNDELLTSNTCIDTIGSHYLRYNDNTINFYIEPLIEGVEEGHIYYEPVMISYNGGYATLNDDGYTSHQEIIDIGYYRFVIEGVNGYKKELNFEIGAVVEGITNNTVYEEGVTVHFTGQGYLNNQYVKSPVIVEHDGEYILKIKGQDGYLESYYFEIVSVKEETTFIDFVQKVDVFVLGAVLIIGIVVVKRKK